MFMDFSQIEHTSFFIAFLAHLKLTDLSLITYHS